MNMSEGKLRIETSLNSSGTLFNENKISILREKDYYIIDYPLDGDAPKQFIKIYCYKPKSKIRRSRPKTWEPYIAKTAEKWYPHESVIEYMINKIGLCFDIRMNEVKLVKANNQIRFLSKYFLNKNEVLYHGADICGEYLEDEQFAREVANNRRTARDLFTYEFVTDAIESVFKRHSGQLITDLNKILIFDAIVGNNDRHFYNWAVVTYKKRTKKIPFISPIYDTARGLMWNQSDKQIEKLRMLESSQFEKKINDYIFNSYPRISIEKNKNANHFDLIGFIKKQKSEYSDIIDEMASHENEKHVFCVLEDEIFPFFLKQRCEVISLILKKRFEIIRGL